MSLNVTVIYAYKLILFEAFIRNKDHFGYNKEPANLNANFGIYNFSQAKQWLHSIDLYMIILLFEQFTGKKIVLHRRNVCTVICQ